MYTTDLITNILKEEGEDLFDSRSASLGHTLQGGIPSPMDRARAVRLASKCVTFLEENARSLKARPRLAPKDTAATIAIQGTSVVFVPIQDAIQHADIKNRRALKSWWEPLKKVTEQLGGLPQLDT